MRRVSTGIRSEKCVVRRFRRFANVYLHKPRAYNIAYHIPRLYGLAILLIGYKPVEHVILLNIVGNCNTVVSNIILWYHRRICGPSLAETSLCGAYLYMYIIYQM